MVAYVLVCAAVAPYLVRLGEFTVREAWPAALGAVALVAILVTEIAGTAGPGRVALVMLVVLVAAAAAVHAIRLRSGTLAARVGAYDTPVAADGLATPADRHARP